MLKPLFTVYREHVGWIEPGKFVFDTGMAYVAFIAKGHAWSGPTGLWLGSSENDHLFDTSGRTVAWSPDLPVIDRGHPLRQFNAIKPVTPVRPVRPVSPRRPVAVPTTAAKWSGLSIAEWLAVGIPQRPVLDAQLPSDEPQPDAPPDKADQ